MKRTMQPRVRGRKAQSHVPGAEGGNHGKYTWKGELGPFRKAYCII